MSLQCKLIDACVGIYDCPHSTAPDEGMGFPLIRTPNIGKGRLNLQNVHRVSQAVYDKRNARAIPTAGDLIFAREAPAGNVACILEGQRVCLGQRTVLIRPNTKLLDSMYLAYYLLSPDQQERFGVLANGATVSHVNIPDIKALPISVPPLPTQRHIAAVLSALDDKIENNRKICATLEAQAQAIFKEWFVDFGPWGGKMPAGWRVEPLGKTVDSTLNGDWGKDVPDGKNDNPVYCIRGADIPEVSRGNKGKMPLRYILPKNYVAKRLTDGDVVVEISGGSPTQSTGRAALITESLLRRYDRGMVCTNFCKAVKPKTGYSSFFYFWWRYLYEQDVFFQYENGTTGIKNLDFKTVLSERKVPIPDMETVGRFSKLVATNIDMISEKGLETESLVTLRDALLPKLMSGEIDVGEVAV